MKLLNQKKCPRCAMRVDREVMVCPRCRLNYTKFESATNLEAKSAIAQRDDERVLLRKGCPADVARWRLLLLTIFLGYMGAHYYYVGRYKRGIFYTVFFLIGLANAMLNFIPGVSPRGDLWEVFTFLVLIWGIVILLWLVDILKVAINRFKIPVSLPR